MGAWPRWLSRWFTGRRSSSQLKTNTLNLFDTTVIATSSVAPAYSLAASVALVFAAVGVVSPAAIIVSFIPVLFIAMAYYYLNRMDPNCGASYSWVSRTLNPYIGWFSGWVQLAANVLFCASAPIVAGLVHAAAAQQRVPRAGQLGRRQPTRTGSPASAWRGWPW